MTTLRSDLELRVGADGPTIYDPLRNRYVRIPIAEIGLLAKGAACREAEHRAAHDELVRATTAEASANLAARARRANHGWLAFLMHRYLFLRIPLVRPDKALGAMLPFVRPLMTVWTAALFVLLGTLGLALVGRQWGLVEASFAASLSFDRALGYAVAVAVLKALHELGHAFALKRCGGRVPTIGVAFVVLFPILYTDTTDAWLCSRRERLLVDAAGILTELGVAVLATWVWLVLPDGGARDIAFALAAVSWTISLAVNLNPFMRFDGYHLLADAIGVPNLQERSFALGRWRLRELLFAPANAPPEPFEPRLRRFLVLYAWTTWIYRLLLFVGIAVLVYVTTFKLLGIVMFCVEIVHFVARPVWQELRTWPPLVSTTRRRSLAPLLVVLAATLLLFAPLDRTARVPAVLEVGRVTVLRVPFAGRIEAKPAVDGTVRRGEPLLQVRPLDDRYDAIRFNARHGALLKRTVHSDRARDRLLAHEGEVALVAAERREWILRGLKGRIVAPSAGHVKFADGLAQGQTVGAGDPVATLVSPGDRIVALAAEPTLRRLVPNSRALFVPDATGVPLPVWEAHRADYPVTRGLPEELADRHGGPVRTGSDDRRPSAPHFAVRYTVASHPLPPGRWRGVLVADVEPRSYAQVAFERIAALLVRESGF